MLIGVGGPLIAGMYPQETVAALFHDRPEARIRGAIAPKGVAVPVKGGYVISGQWPFASGGPAPDFVSANCLVVDGDSPRIGTLGIPDTVMALMPATDVEFLDTWPVVGLRGTDSCDFAAREVFVPEEPTVSVLGARNCYDTPAARLPIRVVLASGHASVAVGIAQGALDDVALPRARDIAPSAPPWSARRSPPSTCSKS
jgi:alkylation response protein AidB-like acyl-CoA dehydrogenase